MKPDQERVKDLIKDTVLLLCKNGLSYLDELRIEGVIGVTLDNKDLFLVHVNEKLNTINEIVDDKNPQDEIQAKDCDTELNLKCNTSQSHSRQNEDSSHCINQKTETYNSEIDGRTGDSATVIKIEDDDESAKNEEHYSQQHQPFSTHSSHMPNKRPHPSTSHQPQSQGIMNLPISGGDLELCEPDPKHFVQDSELNDTFRLGFGGGGSLEPQVWSQLGEFASQQVALEAPTSFNALGPCPPLNSGSSRGMTSDGVRLLFSSYYDKSIRYS